MSLVDFFFNPDYRESLIDKRRFVNVTDNNIKTTKIDKERLNRKFWRDYHLKEIQHEVDLLQSDIIYGFIEVKDITKEMFMSFLKSRNAHEWTHKVLWKRFKIKNKL